MSKRRSRTLLTRTKRLLACISPLTTREISQALGQPERTVATAVYNAAKHGQLKRVEDIAQRRRSQYRGRVGYALTEGGRG